MDDTFNYILHRLSGRVDSPRLEARRLQETVIKSPEKPLSPEERIKLDEMITRRLNGWPLDKLLGKRDFYKYSFEVNEDVLSPRPDTEILVEAAARLIFEHGFSSALEFGVGSGCILLSLLADFPKLSGWGTDISEKALAVASRNARALGVSARASLLHLGWFDDHLPDILGRRFDIILSNPPYIPTNDIAGLDAEVRCHDPLLALDGGPDGLVHYRRLAEITPPLLNDGGFILLEGGQGQAHLISGIFAAAGLTPVSILSDLSGIERCIILKK